MSLQNGRTYCFLWGFFAGAVFGALYGTVYGLIADHNWVQVASYGVMVGATAGMIAGLLSGWWMDHQLDTHFKRPLSDIALQQLQQRIQRNVPLIASSLTLVVLLAFFLRVDAIALMVLPALCSGWLLRYAAHRFSKTLPTQYKLKIVPRGDRLEEQREVA